MTKLDFSIIWRYFAFSNMLLSTSVLWLATKYLFDRGTFHWIVSLPAVIGTSVSVSYIMTAGIGLNLPMEHGKLIGAITGAILLILLIMAHKKHGQVASVSP